MTPLAKPVRRVLRRPFFTFGPDRDRPFVASLEPGDVLTLRALGRRNGAVTVALADVYRFALARQVNAARLEKARQKKAKLAAARG
jgi:hypothetical protein